MPDRTVQRKYVSLDNNRIDLLPAQGRESRVDLAFAACVANSNLLPVRAAFWHIRDADFRIAIGRVYQKSDLVALGTISPQQFQFFQPVSLGSFCL